MTKNKVSTLPLKEYIIEKNLQEVNFYLNIVSENFQPKISAQNQQYTEVL